MHPKKDHRVISAFVQGIFIYLTFAVFLIMILLPTLLANGSDGFGTGIMASVFLLEILPVLYIVPVMAGFFQGLILKEGDNNGWKPFIVGLITGIIGMVIISLLFLILSISSGAEPSGSLFNIDYKGFAFLASVGLINGIIAYVTKVSLSLFYPEKETCPKCGFVIENAENFCPECGAYLKGTSLKKTYYCTECGSTVGEEDKFCPVCGKPLDLIDEDESEEATYDTKKKKIIIRKKELEMQDSVYSPDNLGDEQNIPDTRDEEDGETKEDIDVLFNDTGEATDDYIEP